MNDFAKKLAAPAFVVASFLGWNLYGKTKTNHAMHDRLAELCGPDSGCQMAVDKFFEPCFSEHYRLSARRRSSRVDPGKLVACINHRSGQQYFAFE